MKILGKLHKGWMRAWVVASMLITLVVFAQVYPSKENQRTWFSSGYTKDQIITGDDERMALEEFFSRSFVFEGAENCRDYAYLRPLIEGSKKSLMVVDCPRSGLERFARPLFIAAIMSVLLFLAGLVVCWVRKGFVQQMNLD